MVGGAEHRRVVLVVVGVVVALAAGPGVASADLTVSDATIADCRGVTGNGSLMIAASRITSEIASVRDRKTLNTLSMPCRMR